MAGAQQQGGGGGGSDNSLAPLWITILLFLTGFLVWYMAHGYIVAFVFTLKTWQADFVRLFFDVLGQEVVFMKGVSPETVTFKQMAAISTNVGNFVRYPVIAILMVLAVVIYVSNATLRFKRSYTMQSLIESESVLWPQITPILKLNLREKDIHKGPWAMALTPMQFAKNFKLLVEEAPDPRAIGVARPTVTVNKGETKRIFTMQLGAYWEGPEKLDTHTRALFAVFIARLNRDQDGAEALLKQVAISTASGKLDFSGADALLRKYKDSQIVQDITGRHAYVLTVLASILELARLDGVLPSADFLWLRPLDRPLWYMLNNVGRVTAFSEVSGPYAHWLAEKKMGRPMMVPMVDEAVLALEAAIKDILYIPDRDEEADS